MFQLFSPTISNFVTWKLKCSLHSRVPLFATLWAVAYRILCPWNSSGKNTQVAIPFFRGSSWPRLNPGLLHCRQILSCLSHQGSPNIGGVVTKSKNPLAHGTQSYKTVFSQMSVYHETRCFILTLRTSYHCVLYLSFLKQEHFLTSKLSHWFFHFSQLLCLTFKASINRFRQILS